MKVEGCGKGELGLQKTHATANRCTSTIQSKTVGHQQANRTCPLASHCDTTHKGHRKSFIHWVALFSAWDRLILQLRSECRHCNERNEMFLASQSTRLCSLDRFGEPNRKPQRKEPPSSVRVLLRRVPDATHAEAWDLRARHVHTCNHNPCWH